MVRRQSEVSEVRSAPFGEIPAELVTREACGRYTLTLERALLSDVRVESPGLRVTALHSVVGGQFICKLRAVDADGKPADIPSDARIALLSFEQGRVREQPPASPATEEI